MRRWTLGLTALGLILAAGSAHAQDAWTLDVRAGAALPTQDLGANELDTGFGFEGTLGYRVMPHLSLYGGWGWHRFGSSGAANGTDLDFEETGYAFGLRFEHPFSGESGDGPAYRFRAGGTYGHIEAENPDGEIVTDTGHGAGWELGGGITFALGDAWRLSPGVRYRALSRDLTIGEAIIDAELEYVAVDLGVTWSF